MPFRITSCLSCHDNVCCEMSPALWFVQGECNATDVRVESLLVRHIGEWGQKA